MNAPKAAPDIAPLMIVTGDERYARDRFLSDLQRTLLGDEPDDFNKEVCSAKLVNASDVIDMANQMPMMADWRLIIVEACEQWKAPDWKIVRRYAESPSQSSCLVLILEGGRKSSRSLPRASKVVKRMKFTRPKPWELVAKIAEMARDMDLKLNRSGAEMVAELSGDDLAKVASDLEKLGLYRLGESIGKDDVAALLGRTRHVTRWELGKLIGQRDLGAALVKAQDILDSGEDVIPLLGSVGYTLRQLIEVKALVVKGVKAPGIASALGVPPKIARDLISYQHRYSDYELRRAFDLLRESDVKTKSARLDRRLILLRFLARVVAVGRWSPPKVRRSLSRIRG